MEKQIRVENLSSYSYDGIVEGYFEIDNCSGELKDKIQEYNKARRDGIEEGIRQEKFQIVRSLKGLLEDEIIAKKQDLI